MPPLTYKFFHEKFLAPRLKALSAFGCSVLLMAVVVRFDKDVLALCADMLFRMIKHSTHIIHKIFEENVFMIHIFIKLYFEEGLCNHMFP